MDGDLPTEDFHLISSCPCWAYTRRCTGQAGERGVKSPRESEMNAEIEATKKDVLYWMLEFIEDDDEPPYSKSDVEECGAILSSFIEAVERSDEKADFQWVKSKVKELVLVLNDFNEKHDHTIIETDQRESICDLISQVIVNAGHQVAEDITEEWREW